MSKLSKSSLLIIVILLAFVVLFRLIPHPANFAPVGALALLSGFLLPRKYAILLPVAAMVISDLIIGTHNLVLWTWGSFALLAFISSSYAKNHQVGAGSVFAGAIGGGVLFFLITNFAVWLQSGMYLHTIEGLAQCYYNAIPFFRNTLLGNVFFSATFYAVYIAIKDIKLNNIISIVKT